MANTQFSITVRVKNTGNSVWWSNAVNNTAPYKLAKSNSESWGLNESILPQNYVDPNAEVVFTLVLTAPSSLGQKTLAWRMSKGTTLFGAETAKTIEVVSATPQVFDITPINGTGNETTFSAKFSGGQYKPTIARYIFYQESTNNCTIEYNRTTNQITIGPFGGPMNPPITLPSTAITETNNCYLKLMDTMITGGGANEGNIIFASFRVGFKGPLIGKTVTVYTYVENTATQNTTYIPQGNWTVPGQISVAVSPTSASLVGGQSQVISSTVSGTSNTLVGWTSYGYGSVTNTSPNTTFTSTTVSSTQYTTVRATSAADNSKWADSSLTIQPNASVVSITALSPTGNSGRYQSFTVSANGGGAPISIIQFYANSTALNSGGCLVTVYPQSGYVTVGSNGGGSVGGSLGSGTILQWTNCKLSTGSSAATISGNNATATFLLDFSGWDQYGWISLFAKASNTAGANMLDWEYRGSWFLN